MEKVVTAKQAASHSKELRKQSKIIVVAGGCFDILHKGHVRLLKSAKEKGDVLFVLLESDATIARSKGDKRPINTQNDRAEILSSLASVDYVVKLPQLMTDEAYDNVILSLNPAIIATTEGDPYRSHKERQAASIKGKVVDVTEKIADASTTRLAQLLSKEL